MATGGFEERLREVGRRSGLAAVGVAPVEVFESTLRSLLDRKAEGLNAGMQFTYRNPKRSTDPARILPGAASLVVGAMSYARPRPAKSDTTRPLARVARYATGDTYGELRNALAAVARVLVEAGHRAVVVADDNALVDREAARRAGLGFYGKNSNLLLGKAGSWFVLGTVVTDAVLRHSGELVPDGCGPCRRCLEGCPTGAIIAPGVVDANRCLAWLLQATGDFPTEFREALGDRLYGCDDCQEVCPPNRRAEQSSDPGEDASVDVLELLAARDEELMQRYGRWYIPNRDPRYLRRNALVVLANTGDETDPAVADTVRRYLQHPDEMLARHADWAASRLGVRVAGSPGQVADSDPGFDDAEGNGVAAGWGS